MIYMDLSSRWTILVLVGLEVSVSTASCADVYPGSIEYAVHCLIFGVETMEIRMIWNGAI